MTIRVTIGVPAEESAGLRVSRESEKTGEHVADIMPGQSVDTYFWKDNKLVLREIPLTGEEVATPRQLLQETTPKPQPARVNGILVTDLDSAVDAVIRNRDSMPDPWPAPKKD